MKKKIIYSILIGGFIVLMILQSNFKNFNTNLYALGAEWLNLKKEKRYSLEDLDIDKKTDELFRTTEEFFKKGTQIPVNGKVKYLEELAIGKVLTEFIVHDGKKQGDEKRYYPNGALFEITPYKDGKINGIIKQYYEDGKLWRESPFVDGESEGTEIIYYQNGTKMEENIYLNSHSNHTSKKSYYESGKIEREESSLYLGNDRIDTDMTIHEKNGTKIEGHYTNNKLNGFLKSYHPNGKIWKIMYFKNDEIIGIEEEYYSDGKLRSEIPHKDGKIDGIARTYFENGNLSTEIPYKKGKMNGVAKFYDKSGKLGRETPYKNDEQDGTSNFYTENGELCLKIQYSNGVVISSSNALGRPLTSAQISNVERGAGGVSCN